MMESDEDILLFWRRQLSLQANVSFRGEHDPSKLSQVCKTHQVADSSSILVLYDDTIFGSAKEGFVIARDGVGFKNIGEEPKWLPFAGLEVDKIEVRGHAATDLGGLRVDGDIPGVTAASFEFCRRVAEGLQQMARLGARSGQGGVYRTQVERLRNDGRGRLLQLSELLVVVRQVFEPNERCFVSPEIPPRKLKTVTELYGIEAPEHLAFVYDDTLLGSAEDGVVITTKRVAFKEFLEEPCSLWFETLHAGDIDWTRSGELSLRGRVQNWHQLSEKKLGRLLSRIVDLTTGAASTDRSGESDG